MVLGNLFVYSVQGRRDARLSEPMVIGFPKTKREFIQCERAERSGSRKGVHLTY